MTEAELFGAAQRPPVYRAIHACRDMRHFARGAVNEGAPSCAGPRLAPQPLTVRLGATVGHLVA
jgi:hypothetical protein